MLSIYPMSYQERNSRVTQTYKTCQTCTMKEKAVSVKPRTSFPWPCKLSISCGVKLVIEIDLTRCGGFNPRL